MTKSTRPLVIYHGNCADGFSAAWCFWRKYGPDADYIAGVYQQEPPAAIVGRDVYLVDFSYKRVVVEAMLRLANSVTLIDHHKTAIDDLRPVFEPLEFEAMAYGAERRAVWFCDLERSGATLAWDFLFPNEPRPLLLGHIEDRDLWRFKLPNTRQIQAAVFGYEYSFETWDVLMGADPVALMELTAQGAAIERKHHKDVAELVKVCARRMVIGGHSVPVACLPYTMSSDAGHLMAQGEAFAACYWDTSEDRVFSLRATDAGVDVSEIATIYGGGGHAKAAGFKVPRNHALAIS